MDCAHESLPTEGTSIRLRRLASPRPLSLRHLEGTSIRLRSSCLLMNSIEIHDVSSWSPVGWLRSLSAISSPSSLKGWASRRRRPAAGRVFKCPVVPCGAQTVGRRPAESLSALSSPSSPNGWAKVRLSASLCPPCGRASRRRRPAAGRVFKYSVKPIKPKRSGESPAESLRALREWSRCDGVIMIRKVPVHVILFGTRLDDRPDIRLPGQLVLGQRTEVAEDGP